MRSPERTQHTLAKIAPYWSSIVAQTWTQFWNTLRAQASIHTTNRSITFQWWRLSSYSKTIWFKMSFKKLLSTRRILSQCIMAWTAESCRMPIKRKMRCKMPWYTSCRAARTKEMICLIESSRSRRSYRLSLDDRLMPWEKPPEAVGLAPGCRVNSVISSKWKLKERPLGYRGRVAARS